MSFPKVPPEFYELTTAQKVEWVQRLWGEIVESGVPLELSDEEIRELDCRLDAHESDPTDVISWEVLKRDLSGD